MLLYAPLFLLGKRRKGMHGESPYGVRTPDKCVFSGSNPDLPSIISVVHNGDISSKMVKTNVSSNGLGNPRLIAVGIAGSNPLAL